MSACSLLAQGLVAGYGERTILHDVSLTVPAGQTTAIVGANACGKSTLLRVLSRLLTPTQGSVLLEGNDIHQLPTRRLAQQLGFLPQSPIAPEGISVLELVSRGRHPHQGLFKRWSAADETAVADALAATHMSELAERHVDELSGGQLRRPTGRHGQRPGLRGRPTGGNLDRADGARRVWPGEPGHRRPRYRQTDDDSARAARGEQAASGFEY